MEFSRGNFYVSSYNSITIDAIEFFIQTLKQLISPPPKTSASYGALNIGRAKRENSLYNSSYDVVSSNGVSILSRVRLLTPFLQHERSK